MPKEPKWRPRMPHNAHTEDLSGQRLAPSRAVDVKEIEVIEWIPNAEGKGDPTEVWLIQRIEGRDEPIVLRFKGPDTLDAIIAALTKHRIGVFGEFRS
jgi:hypothetical protein